MTELITTADIGLTAEREGLDALVTINSAFMTVAPKGTISFGGKIKEALKVADGQNFTVLEGGTKPVLKSEYSDILINVSKKAYIVVTTTEADAAKPEVAAAFQNVAPSLFAKEYDEQVAGIKTDPTPNGIRSLLTSTNVVSVEVTAGADLKKAVGALYGTGGLPSAFVISTALFGDYISLDATETDRRISNELATNGSILGIPVKTFRSSQKTGFLRDFTQDEWALKDDAIVMRKVTAGTITDSLGVEHNLGQNNKVAYIMEGFYSWYANPVNATVLLTEPVVTP